MVLFRATPPVCMYPTGADLSACVTMEPNHGGNTATGDAPYRFTISQADGSPATEYTIGQILTSKYYRYTYLDQISPTKSGRLSEQFYCL